MTISEIAKAVGADLAPTQADSLVHRVSTDSRDIRPGDLFVAIRGPRFDGHEYIAQAAEKGAVACICEARLTQSCVRENVTHLRVDDSVAALGKLAAYYRNKFPSGTVVIAVTGSNGKTTTKCMIDHVLSQAFRGKASPKSFNNEIGLPLTLLTADFDDRYVVAEIGTNSPGEIDALARIAKPDVAVITSIGEAHLEGLGGVDGVAAEKSALLSNVKPGGMCVVNIDRAEIRPFLSRANHARLVTVGVDSAARLQVSRRSSSIRGSEFQLDGRFKIQLPMPGAHHATNAAATFAVARWFGIEPAQIISALQTFIPPEGRTRLIEIGGLTLVDDSYNANPGSVSAAIEALCSPGSTRRVLVLGDMLELGEEAGQLHESTVREAARSSIDVFVGVGGKISQAVTRQTDGFTGKKVHSAANADAACAILDSILREGDTVWVKASRAMGLDRVVQHLCERWAPRSAVA